MQFAQIGRDKFTVEDYFNAPIRRYLLSYECLRKWSAFNMKERCQKIERKFDVKATLWKLRKFYKLADVTYRVSSYTWRTTPDKEILRV